MKSYGPISTAQLPDYRLDPPEDDDSPSAYEYAEEVVCDFPLMAEALLNDEFNLSSIVEDCDKPIKIFGRFYRVNDAMILAACCLDAEQRRVILDDVRDYYIDHVANQMDK